MNEPVDITSATMDALQDTTRCIHCGMTRAQHFTPPLAPHLPPPALGHCIGYKAAPPKATPSDLHSRSAQRRVAAMTPPREPRTAANRARIVLSPEDLATINAGGSVPITIADADLRPVRLAIEAEAAGAPLRDFARYVEAMNPTSGTMTFAMRVDLQNRARAALAASSYFGQPPPDDWEDMPAAATPAPAPLDVNHETVPVACPDCDEFITLHHDGGSHKRCDVCGLDVEDCAYARLTARAAAAEDTE